MDDSSQRLHVIIHGRVQGVGFRYATARMAEGLGLCGWVRNLPDGAVEAAFEGPRERLEAAREWCERGPAFARVTHVDTQWLTECGGEHGFTIRD